MKERGIIFSRPMVRAILDGRKTQTRRVIKRHAPWNRYDYFPADRWWVGAHPGGGWWAIDVPEGPEPGVHQPIHETGFPAPYGEVGDRLYVRETHYRFGHWVKNGFTEAGRQKWRFKGNTEEVRRV